MIGLCFYISKKMTKRFHVCLPQQYIDRLAAEAKLAGLSVSEIIRRAIDLYLKEIK
jgi:predicted DNA-binding protein